MVAHSGGRTEEGRLGDNALEGMTTGDGKEEGRTRNNAPGGLAAGDGKEEGRIGYNSGDGKEGDVLKTMHSRA